MVPVYAAVDVGSNNVRMDMYGVTADGALEKLQISEQSVFACRLAEGMAGKNPVIRRENLELAVAAMAHFDAVLKKYDIKPDNCCTIMTEAVRAVQNSKQGKRDIEKLGAAFGGRAFTVLSGREEAVLVGEAVKLACPRDENTKQGLGFASIGGGSIELGVITEKGRIKNPVALPFGIHPLMKQSGGDIKKAEELLRRAMRHRKCPQPPEKILAVIGGNWRALGEAVCGRKLPAALSGATIETALKAAEMCGADYYRSLGGRAKKRAEFMPMAAATLRGVAGHFGAEKIVFLEVSVRDAMARRMHAQHGRKIRAKESGLKQPSSP